MRGLPSILSLFRNELNKFNNTRARLLDKTSFWNINRVSYGLDTDPDIGQNCLQRVSTDGKELSLSFCISFLFNFFTCSSGKWQNSRNDSSSSSTTETVWSHAENINNYTTIRRKVLI